MKTLSGKNAIVTGASRGIGSSTALALAEAGANVVINYDKNECAAHKIKEEVQGKGVNALMIQAHIGYVEQAKQLVQRTLQEWGTIDIFVNNAGITRDNLIMRMKEDEFDEVIHTNLKGVFNGIKEVTRPMMKQRSGHIINISSIVGVQGNVGQANYAAAKAAVIGLTKTAARELAPRGIRVNCIAPGLIETDMTRQLPEAVVTEMKKNIPLARFGRPEEIANVVVFLASDSASYMTGQTIHVNGGMHM